MHNDLTLRSTRGLHRTLRMPTVRCHCFIPCKLLSLKLFVPLFPIFFLHKSICITEHPNLEHDVDFSGVCDDGGRRHCHRNAPTSLASPRAPSAPPSTTTPAWASHRATSTATTSPPPAGRGGDSPSWGLGDGVTCVSPEGWRRGGIREHVGLWAKSMG